MAKAKRSELEAQVADLRRQLAEAIVERDRARFELERARQQLALRPRTLSDRILDAAATIDEHTRRLVRL